MLSRQQLIDFEERVKAEFLAGRIRGPVHLCDENQIAHLLEIFQDIRPQDWVFAGWRSHFHALLKGIPEDELFQQICAGRSMMIHSREHRFVSSAIVGGVAPIALGVALAVRRAHPKRRRDFPERVWLFVGDMTVSTGIAHEVMNYAHGFGLPLTVVVENNGLSTNTPTQGVWGECKPGYNHRYYEYERTVPHVGVGQFVRFS